MMTTTGSSSARHNTSRFPFTGSQWQELEHQALIFKYMVSGMPIPPDLLFTIKTSFDSKFHLHQPQHIGWNCFQMGFGRKIDPEPGRCRRTDGKKWRCSKEAYPDSKYCERHMHRGRNRSRKPVETTTTTTLTSDNNINIISSLSSTRDPLPTAIPISSSTRNSPTTYNNSVSSIPSSYNNPTLLQNPFHFPNSSSLRPSAIDLESGPYSQTHKDYRNRSYGNGMKEEIDEHAFFSESSGTMTSMSGSSVGDSSWHLEPLTMAGSGSTLKQRTCSGLQIGGYSYLGLTPKEKQDQQQDYYVLDDDVALKMNRGDEPQKVMHHFFDEWPKNKDSWLETEDRGQASTTQLSISMPKSSPYDFFMTHNEK